MQQTATASKLEFAAMYAFLKEHYLHSRFEGRNGSEWGADYSKRVTESSIEQVEQTGRGFVSLYESRLGRVVIFDRNLTVLNPDEPPAQIQRQAPHITHVCGV